METLLKADIFFFIASIATVSLTFLASIMLFYLIKAGKNLYVLSETIKGGFKESEEFIADLRERLEGNMVFRIFFPRLRRRRPIATKDDNENK